MQRPAVNPAVLISPVADGYVAYNPVSDRLHQLNPLAALIAELCDGSRTVEEIDRLIAPVVPAGRTSEVDRWIQDGLDSEFLILADGLTSRREFSAEELCDLADRLWENGKVQPAFLCQKQASELKDDDADIWCSLGELAHIVGRREEARDAYARCLELKPGDAEVAHLLVALRDDAPPPRVPDSCIQQLYQRFSSFFDTNLRDELGYQGPERMRDLIVDVTANRSGLTTLDLGCGTGLSGVAFRQFSASLVGVDLSPEMVELARNRDIYDALEVEEITSWLRQPRDHFDVIVACDTLIYFGDLRQVIVPATELLEPGGIIAFSLEKGDRHPFHLTDSGRYAHHPTHVREVADDAGLTISRLEEGFLRTEYGVDVTGLLVALERTG